LNPKIININHNLLLYEKGDSVYNVVTYHSKYSFRAGVMDGTFLFKGRFQWNVLTNRRIVYADPGNDQSFENNEWTYTLHIFSLDTYERRVIHQKYEPLELTEKQKSDEISMFDNYPEELISRMREFIEFRKSVFENAKYYDPFREILTDRNFIFVFTFRRDEEKGVLTYVIDADSGKHLSSVYFDTIPDYIRNGYAYILLHSGSRDEFPLIEKYKLDPAVYGK